MIRKPHHLSVDRMLNLVVCCPAFLRLGSAERWQGWVGT